MAAMVAQLDAKVGQFIAALEKTGQRKNTLVVFTSDNGGIESLKNAYVGNVGDSPLNSENDPLRGQKNTLYEGGIRVCAFANWPGILNPRQHTSPMHVADWFPTIATLTGYTPDADLQWDGVDQWAALKDNAPADPPRTIYIAKQNGQSIRLGDWKLIEAGRNAPQLFNIATDPYEKTDRANGEPEKLAELRSRLVEQKAKDDPNLPNDLASLPK
jgi:arylsulfatase A-like enzyme